MSGATRGAEADDRPSVDDGVTFVDDIAVHRVIVGAGMPVLAIHGLYSALDEVHGFLEPVFAARPGYRRIYVDLPAMGSTPAPARMDGSDDVVDTLLGLVDIVIGDEPFLVLGHSYGGYLARGIAAKRPGQVAGLALVCPMMDAGETFGEHVPIEVEDGAADALTPEQAAEFRGYFVRQTAATAEAFRTAVAPTLGRADDEALTRILENVVLRPRPDATPTSRLPTLVLTGRHDSFVGSMPQWALAAQYPDATFVMLERAGHALPHEEPALFDALIGDWLERATAKR